MSMIGYVRVPTKDQTVENQEQVISGKGYKVDKCIGWPHHGEIEIIQGEDMGMRSRIIAKITDEPGSPIAVSGQARLME